MPDFLNEVMDEAARLIGEISVIKEYQRRGETMAQRQIDVLRHHSAQIVVMLQATEID